MALGYIILRSPYTPYSIYVRGLYSTHLRSGVGIKAGNLVISFVGLEENGQPLLWLSSECLRIPCTAVLM